MYTIRECAACVILMFTLSTLPFGLCILLLTIKWGIKRLRRTSGEIQQDASHTFSRSAVRDARHKGVVGQWNALYARCLKRGASMAYRSRILVASSDPMIRDSHVQSRRPSLR